MSKRKDALKSLMAPVDVTTPDASVSRPGSKPASLRSMGMVLHQMSADAEAARRLNEAVVAGERVIQVDPSLILPSIVRDRMEGWSEGHGFDALVESIAVHGQKVPVLVRPHPDHPDRYQTAYGHRRVAALARLGRPVEVIVRNLSDQDLVLAQAKENLDREDLSFIELAQFATRLDDQGFARNFIQEALHLERTTLAKMISLVRALPDALIAAIGPAPKIGRPRWEELQERMAASGEAWRIAVASIPREATTNERFTHVLEQLSAKSVAAPAELIAAPDGRVIARVARSRNDVKLTIPGRAEPGFGDFLASRLVALHAEFKAYQNAS